MSLPQVAQQLARKGRNGDTMLVHMSKDEVKGLASLAGANGMQLTINPETGLPEAFKLGKVLQAALPIAAGFALGPAGWGLMSSGMAGLTVGGLYGLATGSVEKGLMAGLGAWGGAALGGAGAGASTAAPGTTGALTGSAATTVATPTAASLTTPLTSSATAAPTAFAAQPTVASLTAAPSVGLGTGYGAVNTGIGSIAAPAAGAAPVGTIAGTTAAPASAGIGSSIANFAKTNPWTTAALVGGPLLAGMEQDTPAAVEAKKGMIRPYTFAREVNRDAFKQPLDGSTAERNYFASQKYTPLPAYEAAEGGQVPRYEQMQPGGLAALQGMRDGYAPMTTMDGNIPQYAFGGGVHTATAQESALPSFSFDPQTQQYVRNQSAPMAASGGMGMGLIQRLMEQGGLSALAQQQQLPKFTFDPDTQKYKAMANGGITDLGGYSDGGRLLKGPGDGVSDSIPATINNKQPAKLADGEFVVPARIVSEIGNGSTDAGARKLYAMMDRVQKKRKKTVGKNKVAVNSRADKDLPA